MSRRRRRWRYERATAATELERGTVFEVFRGRRVGEEGEADDVDSIAVFVFGPDDGDFVLGERERFEEC